MTAALPWLWTNCTRAGQWLWYRLYFFEISRKRTTGNSVIFILFHWYSHRGFGCGKMITFTLKILNIFGDVYTRDGTMSLCQCDASAQTVVSHNYRTHVLGSIPFTPSEVTKWHDRNRYLSIHHVPYLMSLSSPGHCSKTLTIGDVYYQLNLIDQLSLKFKSKYKIMQSKMLLANWQLLYSSLDVLIHCSDVIWWQRSGST